MQTTVQERLVAAFTDDRQRPWTVLGGPLGQWEKVTGCEMEVWDQG